MASAPAHAQKFSFPLKCSLGKDCWVLSYVDMDAEQGSATDYKCNARAEDDNKGTDIAIRDRRAMTDGVDVLAASNGTVMRMRDGENDDAKTEEDLADIKARNRDCGNGIVIDHGNNVQTVYCHLKKDSIEVDQDQNVVKGQKIAEIGGSGYSKMPHLHFGIIKDSAIIDPFSGLNNQEKCGNAVKGSLWEDTAIAYQPFGVFDAGFRTSIPDFEAIKAGEINPVTLPHGAQALTFWTGYYGALAGDEIAFKVIAPDGTIFVERRYKQKDNNTRQYYYTGRRIKGGLLQKGDYVGTATVKRGETTQSITRTLNVIE